MRLLVLLALASCSKPRSAEPVTTPVESRPMAVTSDAPTRDAVAAHEGGRHGSHGMALFGKQTYFLDHIPMFEAPHDRQVVLRVRIEREGKPITEDFTKTGHSIQPTAAWSLDDLVDGRSQTFEANIHRGNFEAKGPVVLPDVRITVEAVLVARDLPGTEATAPGMQELFVFGREPEVYAVNVIRRDRGVQQIVRLAETDGLEPSIDRVQRVTVNSATRLSPSPTRRVGTAVETTSKTTFIVGHELWCLQAPQFVDECR